MFFIVSFLFPSLFFYVTSTAIFNEYVPKDKENTAIALVEYSDAKPIINSEEKELKTPLPTSPKPEDF